MPIARGELLCLLCVAPGRECLAGQNDTGCCARWIFPSQIQEALLMFLL